MTDPGLNQRLRQRSRRSGLMIGFSMLLTLMVCVGAFTMIFTRLEPVVADFVGRGEVEAPTPVPTEEPVAAVEEEDEDEPEPTAPPAEDEEEEPPATEEADEPEAEATSAADSDEFEPDYQADANQSINLRPGPGVNSGQPIMALPIAAPLMYLDEEQVTEDPDTDQMSEGQVWMRFRTEDGTEGWIRELDVSEYVP